MRIRLDAFEEICRRAHVVDESNYSSVNSHPFERLNIFPSLPERAKNLFDDGHYSEATFESLKFLDKRVQEMAKSKESGRRLMMDAFNSKNPLIKLNSLINKSQEGEQEGYRYIFAGVMSAIRNPRGHEYSIEDDLDTCLDHLTIVSFLLRRLESAEH